MATYTSKPVTVAQSAADLAERFGDFTRIGDAIAQMPAEQRARVGEVEFSKDSIKMVTPQVGAIELEVVERQPERIALQAKNSPMPMTIAINIKAVSETESEVTGSLEVDIPTFAKPLVGPTMQKAADKFGELFASLA